MENVKKAIILDMDETLERGMFDGKEQIMTLRPHLDELIGKLKEAKEQSIDVILCTTATQQWVDRFLNLKPEFRIVFDKILNRDNEKEWKNYSQEDYPLEYAAKSKDMDIENGKPVTTFGYNSILFIDDNNTEVSRLQSLFDITEGKLERDVTVFSGYGYWPPDVSEAFEFVEAGKQDEEVAEMVSEYLQNLRNENGCLIMCSVIDDFMQKEYEPGLSLVDDKYGKNYQDYKKQTDKLSEEIEEKKYDLEEKLNLDFFSLVYNDPEVSQRYKNFFATDKHYPYQGIEMEKSKTQGKIEEIIADVKLSDVNAIINESKQGMQNLTEEKNEEEGEKDGKE